MRLSMRYVGGTKSLYHRMCTALAVASLAGTACSTEAVTSAELENDEKTANLPAAYEHTMYRTCQSSGGLSNVEAFINRAGVPVLRVGVEHLRGFTQLLARTQGTESPIQNRIRERAAEGMSPIRFDLTVRQYRGGGADSVGDIRTDPAAYLPAASMPFLTVGTLGDDYQRKPGANEAEKDPATGRGHTFWCGDGSCYFSLEAAGFNSRARSNFPGNNIAVTVRAFTTNLNRPPASGDALSFQNYPWVVLARQTVRVRMDSEGGRRGSLHLIPGAIDAGALAAMPEASPEVCGRERTATTPQTP